MFVLSVFGTIFGLRMTTPAPAVTTSSILPQFTAEQLKEFDGSNPDKPIYLALDGFVYDVTEGKEFYQPGGAYHNLAGKDSSGPLHLVGGSIIKHKYKVIGALK